MENEIKYFFEIHSHEAKSSVGSEETFPSVHDALEALLSEDVDFEAGDTVIVKKELPDHQVKELRTINSRAMFERWMTQVKVNNSNPNRIGGNVGSRKDYNRKDNLYFIDALQDRESKKSSYGDGNDAKQDFLRHTRPMGASALQLLGRQN